MARARRKRARKRKSIVFVLTAQQKRDLKKRGLLRNKRGTLRVKYVSGWLHVTHHKKGPKFVASNAAFA